MIEKLKNPLTILLFLLYHYHEKGQLLLKEKDLLKSMIFLLLSFLPPLPPFYSFYHSVFLLLTSLSLSLLLSSSHLLFLPTFIPPLPDFY